MNEKHIKDNLNDYIDGTVTESEQKRIENHIAVCENCRKEYDALMALLNKLHNLPKSIIPPADLLEDVESKIEEAHSLAKEIQKITENEIPKSEKPWTKIFNIFSAIPVRYSRVAATFAVLAAVVFIWYYAMIYPWPTKNNSTPGNTSDNIVLKSAPAKVNRSARVKANRSAPVKADRSAPVTVDRRAPVTMDRRAPVTMDQRAPVAVDKKAPMQGIVQYNNNYRLQYQQFNTEEYDRIYENDFLNVADDPLSTFSIDVDNASYSNVRRFIEDGQMPPADAVRTEELINYFSYDYPQPEGKDPFSMTMEMAECPWNRNHKLLLVGLQGKKIQLENLPPSNLVFLLDVSGSMDEPDKLPLVKSAFRLLVDQLRAEDRVAIAVYAGSAGLVLESTPGNEKQKILRAIDNLQAGGTTAGGEGISLAYRIAGENFIKKGNNRVILATDGDFNVGLTSDAELVRLIEEKRNDGIFLSVLGFGTGNYKDSKMEKLADKGNGNYAYVDNMQEARKVFIGQMAGTLFTIAKDVKIQIEFNPSNVKAYRLIGYENRLLDKKDFNDDKKDAGELGSGHSVTALYELITSDESGHESGVDPLKYQTQKPQLDERQSDEILTIKSRYKLPDETKSRLIVNVLKRQDRISPSANLRWAAAVTEFAMLIRNSEFKAKASWDSAIELARESRGNDREGYRAEFIRMLELCRDLSRSYRR
jgi:Ca-activated chloride channel homolog